MRLGAHAVFGSTSSALYNRITMKHMSTITATPSNKTTRKDTRLTEALNLVLADSYTLMGLTHLAHWNVEGSDFFQLHKAFEKQYENLFEAVDEIAERVRALDSYAAGGLSKLARMSEMDEFSAPMPQKEYVSRLIVAHDKLVEDAQHTRGMAGEANDLETQDLMIKRLAWHQKTIWMLKSYLKH
jgi:starvation-inducible DNA-binding protein